MYKRIMVFLLAALVMASGAQAAGNEWNDSFSKAKKTLERQVYYDHRITLYCGAAFDEKKNVTLDGGSALPYTKLIFALGSESFIPPIPGHDQEGVVAIRRIGDVEKVQAMGSALKRAVVIGGGVLGLEAAWELRKAKCEVTEIGRASCRERV